MPREDVTDEYGFVAQVRWQPEGTIQLATVASDVTTFVAWCRDIVEQYDKAEATRKGNGAMLAATESMGMFWTPDRRQTQALIRNLKRARNGVYGADE